MTTITISVDSDVEERFRESAKKQYGGKKGYLGDAVTEAMKKWLLEVTSQEIAKRALNRMRKGFNMGGLTYSKREELYER